MVTAPATLDQQHANTGFVSREHLQSEISAKWIGLVIATLVPALFWTGAVWLIGKAVGIEIATVTLVTMATTVTAFLSYRRRF